jgi:GDP-mannose 6-dehydrogenase
MRISIFGLGYVGAVTAACFAKIGHTVIGVDVVDYKINLINSGQAPLEEKGLNDLISEQVKRGKLFATKDTQYAIKNSDISFICVGTPPQKDGSMDISFLERVCEEIGKALKDKKNHTVVIRSTMFPGSLDILRKILEKYSGKKADIDFGLATNPEFLREGSAIKDFSNPPYIIVGSDNKELGKKVFDVYHGIKSKKYLVKADLAQMMKYATNSWHAVKVTFANEIGAICKKTNIDAKKLMSIFCEDDQLNISSYYLKPGFAYGGSCLPKDTSALKNNAKKLGLKTPLINSVSESNFEHINRAVELIESKGKKKIGILGLTFKADTDDIRGNPLLYVLNKLFSKGYEINRCDCQL